MESATENLPAEDTSARGQSSGLQFASQVVGHYFNHAAIAPWPAATAAAVARFAAENARQGPSAYSDWLSLERRLRQQLATLVSAASEQDIALLKNTTEGISTVAWGLDWKAGDNLVLPQGEFPSNRLPWLAQRERGVDVREVDIRGADDAERALIDAMDQDTRLLAVSAVQFNDGFRLDLERLGAACRKRGILFFVDAIQQLGALKIDVSACHIHFLAADAHKWLLGPEGIAVFFSDPESRPLLRLHQLGWHMIDNPWSFDGREVNPSSSARRFEAGSPNTLGQVALNASLGVLFEADLANVEKRVLHNTAHLLERLGDMPGIDVTSRGELIRRSGIVSFRSLNVPASTLHRQLVKSGISCAVRDQAIRLSPHYYQGEIEIEAVMDTLLQISAR